MMCAKKRVQKYLSSHFHHNFMTMRWFRKRRKWIILENWNFNLDIIFFLTSHFHHIFMTIWWNHPFRNIFQNSFSYHCDENVMEKSSSTYLQKLSHHIFITFLSHIYDNEMMLKDHNFTDIFHSKLISLHLK